MNHKQVQSVDVSNIEQEARIWQIY